MLIAALAAPLVAAALVLAAPPTRRGGDVVRAVAAVAAVLWVALLVRGGVEDAGRFAAPPVAAAAACGVALLVVAARPVERDGRDVAVLLVVWGACTLGITAGVGDPSTLPLAFAVAVATAAIAVVRPAGHALPVVLVTAGAALTVAGFAVAGEVAADFGAPAFGDAPVAAALALTGVALVLIGALAGDGPTGLAIVALAVAVVVAPHAGTPAAAVVAFGAAAVVAAWFDRGALATALVAVAALSTSTPAGLLLAAAAVVVTAVPSSPALLAAAPGAAALAQHATHDPSIASLAATAATALAAILLTLGRDLRPSGIPTRAIPAAAAGIHLALVPGTWTWARAPEVLDHWDRGAALAVAVGLLATVAAAATNLVPLPAPRGAPDAETDAEVAPHDPRWAPAARTVALAALGLATVALVRSSLRSV